MKIEATFNVEQLTIIRDLMRGLEDRGLDMAPALNAIAEQYLVLEAEIFGGRNNWAPLTAGTIESKARRGHNEMLVESGVLKGSVTTRNRKWASTKVLGPATVLLGSRAKHGHLLAFGTVERWQRTTGRYTGRVPARQFGVITPAMLNTFYLTLESYLVNGTLTPEPAAGIASVTPLDLSSFDVGI
jgi:hypothetical protein